MALDFVIETPQRRGINRNNYKLIQKRATQAGARTRLDLKSKGKSRGSESLELPLRDANREDLSHDTASADWLVANAGLASSVQSPFFSQFGESGRLICTPSPIEREPTPDSTYPIFSILQDNLFSKIANQPAIISDANRTFKIFNLSQTQFLGQLPSRYGQIAFLDDAMQCLIGRLNGFLPLLKPASSREIYDSQSYLYGKALCSLRAAIDRNLEGQLCEIWFATILLTLSELLAGGDDPGWIWHAAGAARLLYKIGPDQIRSEFQMSVLVIQCKGMVVETITGSHPCYLSGPGWQAALKRTILDNGDEFGMRSRCSIELWCMATRIAELFQNVDDSLHQQAKYEHRMLRTALKRILAQLTDWKDLWFVRLQVTIKNEYMGTDVQHKAFMILSAYFMLSMLACRLRMAVDPWKTSDLEVEALESCNALFQLRADHTEFDRMTGRQWSIYFQFASGTERTTSIWTDQLLSATPDKPIDACIFDEWCRAIGRSRIPPSQSPTWSPESTP